MRVPDDQRVRWLEEGARQQLLTVVAVHGAGSPGDVSTLDQVDYAELLSVMMWPLRGGFSLLLGGGSDPDLMNVDKPRVEEAVTLDWQLSKMKLNELPKEFICGEGWPKRGEATGDSARVCVDIERLEVGIRRHGDELVAARVEVEKPEASTPKGIVVLEVTIRLEVVPLLSETTLHRCKILRQSIICRRHLSEVLPLQCFSDTRCNRDPGRGGIRTDIGHS